MNYPPGRPDALSKHGYDQLNATSPSLVQCETRNKIGEDCPRHQRREAEVSNELPHPADAEVRLTTAFAADEGKVTQRSAV